MARAKRAEPVATSVDSLSHEGRGVAQVGNKVVFIDGALPQEEVVFRYTRRRRRYDEGQLLEVVKASPRRIQARCPHFGICGGCSLQHIDREFQIRHKQQVLIEQLAHIGRVEPKHLLPPLTGPEWGYRRKARLAVKHVQKKGKVLVGFREKASPYVADLARCEVLHPRVGLKLEALGVLVAGLSVYDQIPQIEVAVGEPEVALIFRHLVPLSAEDRARLQSFALEQDFSIYGQSGGMDTVEPIWPETASLLRYSPEDGIVIQFEPAQFTQVNFEINREMVARALTLLALNRSDRVLELFCGLGNFSLPIAARAGFVTAIEGEAALVARAQANAAANAVGNAAFHVMDLCADIGAVPLGGRYNKIFLDPPRSGANQVLEILDYTGIDRIVYVSCNPATLARDAGLLVNRRGYALESCGVMDMFPHTAHLESIALFLRS